MTHKQKDDLDRPSVFEQLTALGEAVVIARAKLNPDDAPAFFANSERRFGYAFRTLLGDEVRGWAIWARDRLLRLWGPQDGV